MERKLVCKVGESSWRKNFKNRKRNKLMEAVHSRHNIPKQEKKIPFKWKKRKRKVFGEIGPYVFLQNHHSPSAPVPSHAKYVKVTTLCCLKALSLKICMLLRLCVCSCPVFVGWVEALLHRAQDGAGTFCSPGNSPQIKQSPDKTRGLHRCKVCSLSTSPSVSSWLCIQWVKFF